MEKITPICSKLSGVGCLCAILQFPCTKYHIFQDVIDPIVKTPSISFLILRKCDTIFKRGFII